MADLDRGEFFDMLEDGPQSRRGRPVLFSEIDATLASQLLRRNIVLLRYSWAVTLQDKGHQIYDRAATVMIGYHGGQLRKVREQPALIFGKDTPKLLGQSSFDSLPAKQPFPGQQDLGAKFLAQGLRIQAFENG